MFWFLALAGTKAGRNSSSIMEMRKLSRDYVKARQRDLEQAPAVPKVGPSGPADTPPTTSVGGFLPISWPAELRYGIRVVRVF